MYKIIGGDQKEYGPVSAEEIRRWLNERRLQATSLVQKEGTSEWKPLSSFGEFTTTLASLSLAASSLATPAVPFTEQRSNSMATAGLVLNCVSLICCWCGGPIAILGIVFSCVGLSQANRDPMQTGRPLAIAGIIIGGVALLLGGIGLALGIFGNLIGAITKH